MSSVFAKYDIRIFKTSIALKVMSSKLPIGVETIYMYLKTISFYEKFTYY